MLYATEVKLRGNNVFVVHLNYLFSSWQHTFEMLAGGMELYQKHLFFINK